MNFRSSLIALAALASLGSAQALTTAQIDAARADGSLKEVRISGASALRLALGGYLQELAETGTFHVFFSDAAGKAHRAYSLELNKDIKDGATTVWTKGTKLLVTKSDGGSGEGVGPLISATKHGHMLVTAANCTALTGDAPSTDVQNAAYTCGSTVSAYAHGGLSDVEPALLQTVLNGGTGLSTASLDSAGFVQNIFGVAVNKSLYLALQKAQGLDNSGAINEDDAKQPSLPISFVRGILTGQISGSSTLKKGWNLVVPTSASDNTDSRQVNVCRRQKGSGTQAASNVFFADAPCGSTAYPVSGGLPLDTTNATQVNTAKTAIKKDGSVAVIEGKGTGDVEKCIGDYAENKVGGAAWALGVIGRENNPKANGGDKGYRFVKLSGVAPTRANVISGDYEFVTESTMQWPTAGLNAPAADVVSFLKDMRANMGKATILSGLDLDLQQGLAATPATVTGAWIDLPTAQREFTSHVARTVGKTCALPRMTK